VRRYQVKRFRSTATL